MSVARPERIAGPDRYTTAVEIAHEAFPDWANCDHVIIASGEDRAAADPLAASGLTWTYGAPILLVQQDRVPSSVLSALDQIADANDGVTVHVVGGPASVPPELLGDIAARVGTVAFDRIEPNDDRFVLAASIARRMSTERVGGFHRMPGYGQHALIANGADPDKFFDALALSPLAARTGYPILLVEEDRVPSATRNVLADLAIPHRVIGGGPATVSEGVAAELAVGAGTPVMRWWGADRYSTAAEIARWGETAPTPWIASHNIGVTAKLPDALAGGALMGLRGSPIVLTETDRLPWATGSYLHADATGVGACYVLGGPVSVTDPTMTQIGEALAP
jgi:putative cell wall-binding protein